MSTAPTRIAFPRSPCRATGPFSHAPGDETLPTTCASASAITIRTPRSEGHGWPAHSEVIAAHQSGPCAQMQTQLPQCSDLVVMPTERAPPNRPRTTRRAPHMCSYRGAECVGRSAQHAALHMADPDICRPQSENPEVVGRDIDQLGVRSARHCVLDRRLCGRSLMGQLPSEEFLSRAPSFTCMRAGSAFQFLSVRRPPMATVVNGLNPSECVPGMDREMTFPSGGNDGCRILVMRW
jgi:hypothetical protein